MADMAIGLDTESRILEIAGQIFRSKGKDGARMQEIADAAGINKALLHYYFHSKDQLFERIFKEHLIRFFSKLNEIIASEEALFDKIRTLCHAYITLTIENPHLPVFVHSEIHKSKSSFIKNMMGKNSKKPDYKILKQQINQEVNKGNIRNIKAEHLLMNILSLCIFPALSKPMMLFNMDMSEKEFEQLLEERKKIVPELIIESIRKN